MADRIETLDRSTVQHGRENDRIYLIRLSEQDLPEIVGKMHNLAVSKGYGKIFVKVPQHAQDLFLDDGYEREAGIPGFFGGREDAVFMGKFLKNERKEDPLREETKKVLETAMGRKQVESTALESGFEFTECIPEDAEEIASIYRRVFSTYPFPIDEAGYIEKTMQQHTEYYGVRHNGSFVSLSSAEMYPEYECVEMTDFATLPAYRGKKLALYQLFAMGGKMSSCGYITAYTIARALSYGMNITFARAGYEYGGTLVNNTNIAGRLESMNIWYRILSPGIQ